MRDSGSQSGGETEFFQGKRSRGLFEFGPAVCIGFGVVCSPEVHECSQAVRGWRF